MVLRHGREAVVVISASQYEKMIHPKESLAEFMRRSPLYGATILNSDRTRVWYGSSHRHWAAF